VVEVDEEVVAPPAAGGDAAGWGATRGWGGWSPHAARAPTASAIVNIVSLILISWECVR
jgi:hypothetical protein